jgi:hypothetical protein
MKEVSTCWSLLASKAAVRTDNVTGMSHRKWGGLPFAGAQRVHSRGQEPTVSSRHELNVSDRFRAGPGKFSVVIGWTLTGVGRQVSFEIRDFQKK